MSYDGPEQRQSDHVDQARRIEDLIAKTADPVQQTALLIQSRFNAALHELSLSLDSNTHATKTIAHELTQHREDFRQHDREEIRRMGWVTGAWWAIAAMFGLIVVLVGFIGKQHLEQASKNELRLTEAEAKVRVIEALLQRLITVPGTTP